MPPELTEKDHEILRYIADGNSMQEMAAKTNYSPNGVKSQMAKMYQHLGASNAPNAVALGHVYQYLNGPRLFGIAVTPEDKRIIFLTACGLTDPEIGYAMHPMTESMVKNHKADLRKTWGARSSAMLVDLTYRAQVIEKIPGDNYRNDPANTHPLICGAVWCGLAVHSPYALP